MSYASATAPRPHHDRSADAYWQTRRVASAALPAAP